MNSLVNSQDEVEEKLEEQEQLLNQSYENAIEQIAE